MFVLSFGLLTFLCVVNVNIESVTCACEKTFAVICDKLVDVQYESNRTKRTWTELFVQPGKYDDFRPKYILSKRQLNRHLSKLQLLIVDRQVKSIERTAFANCKHLDILILYANNLPRIRESTFNGFWHLTKLGLENNTIEEIEQNLCKGSKIKSLDLSHNYLELLVSGLFRNCEVTTLTITHNRLGKIQNNCLPRTLKVLHLDHNRFQFLPLESNNLTQLVEFTISHNQLFDISGMNQLHALEKLDLSFNRITSTHQEFDNLRNLEFLDLSGNNLQKFVFTPKIVINIADKVFTLFLASNRLRNLDFGSINGTEIITTLSGNPWNCECLKRMQKVVGGPESKVKRTTCDQQLFNSGQNPCCIVDDTRQCSEDKVSESMMRKFRSGFEKTSCHLFDIY